MQRVITFSASRSSLRAGLDLDDTWFSDQLKKLLNY